MNHATKHTIMSNTEQSFVVGKCFATKSEEAKFKFILHLEVKVKIPVKNGDGEIVDHDIETKYLRKGSNIAWEEQSTILIEKAKYRVTSHESTWTDEESGEERTATQHWLSPKVEL